MHFFRRRAIRNGARLRRSDVTNMGSESFSIILRLRMLFSQKCPIPYLLVIKIYINYVIPIYMLGPTV